MRSVDIKKLIEWLGRDGAIAGLESSNITVSELYEIAQTCGLNPERRVKRAEIIIDLVNRDSVRIDKTTDELLSMNYDELKAYLTEQKVSRTELLSILSKFNIRPSKESKIGLVDFVAREISDLGMYQRVAKGANGSRA